MADLVSLAQSLVSEAHIQLQTLRRHLIWSSMIDLNLRTNSFDWQKQTQTCDAHKLHHLWPTDWPSGIVWPSHESFGPFDCSSTHWSLAGASLPVLDNECPPPFHQVICFIHLWLAIVHDIVIGGEEREAKWRRWLACATGHHCCCCLQLLQILSISSVNVGSLAWPFRAPSTAPVAAT